MGWINDDGEFNEETFGADVMTLPPRFSTGKSVSLDFKPASLVPSSVAETITEESIGSCAGQMMEEWGEEFADGK